MTSAPPSLKREERRGQGERMGGEDIVKFVGTYSDHLVQLPDHLRADQEVNPIMKDKNKCQNFIFLGTDRHEASVNSLGSLFQFSVTELWSAIQ